MTSRRTTCALLLSSAALAGCSSESGTEVLPPPYQPALALNGTWRWVSSLDVETGVMHTPGSEGFEADLHFDAASDTEGAFVYTRTGVPQTRGQFGVAYEDAPGNDFIALQPGIDYLERNAWLTVHADTLQLNGAMESGFLSRYVLLPDSAADRAAARFQAPYEHLWEESGIEDYELVLQRSHCNCLPEWMVPIRLTVRDGNVESVVHHETGDPITTDLYHAMTVEELFALVAEAARRNSYILTVEYHDTLGYPLSIFIDEDEEAVDDDQRIEVHALTPLS